MNPYDVLHIPPTATDEQVKAAYRELARQYHPDAQGAGGVPTPESQRRMQEINEAYDAIIRQRREAHSDPGGGASAGPGGYGGGRARYGDIRRMIGSGRLADAETLLDGIASGGRDAEWFFLKGSVLYRKGWLEDAYRHFSQACAMEPGNQEYRAAQSQMEYQRRHGTYRTSGARGSDCGCSPCDCCAGLICADCLCDSMRCC